jgi:hypothetical protein
MKPSHLCIEEISANEVKVTIVSVYISQEKILPKRTGGEIGETLSR